MLLFLWSLLRRTMNNLHVILSTVLLLVSCRTTDAKCSREANVVLEPGVTTITSDNFPAASYDDYTLCRWLVTAPLDTTLTFTFAQFDVEGPTDKLCQHDAVTIFDLKKPGSLEEIRKIPICGPLNIPPAGLPTLGGPFCGNIPPADFITAGNTAMLEFCSDYAETRPGFRIDITYATVDPPPAWDEAANIVTLDTVAQTRVIRSPQPYYNDYTATYVIKNARRDKPVYLKKVFYNLGEKCEDKLTIEDVTNAKSYLICGYQVAGPGLNKHIERVEGIEFKDTEEIRIMFVTDQAYTNPGFHFVASLEQCDQNQFACDAIDGGCYSPSESCDGKEDCLDGSDESWRYCAPECGKAHFVAKTQNRIVGGQYVNRHSLPWQVSVDGFCGGTVVSDRWVLSAAHCFLNPGLPRLFFGAHDLSMPVTDDRAVVIGTEKVICHPNYDPYKLNYEFDFDFCLLKTASKIPFRKNIVPACLPAHGTDVAADVECLTSGWGETYAVYTDILKQAFVPVVSREQCSKFFVEQDKTVITNNMICAGFPSGGTDACQGDSGGPFVCKNSDQRWTVNGVVSFGIECALPRHPGVFSNVGAVSHWIADTMAQN